MSVWRRLAGGPPRLPVSLTVGKAQFFLCIRSDHGAGIPLVAASTVKQALDADEEDARAEAVPT